MDIPSDTPQPPIKMLRLPDVMDRTGLSKAFIYEQIAAGDFPQPVNLGSRAVGFVESEIDQWLQDRIKASRAKDEAARAAAIQAEELRQYQLYRELTYL